MLRRERTTSTKSRGYVLLGAGSFGRMPTPAWPLLDLKISAGQISLRLPLEHELFALAEQCDARIYERTGVMPFATDWATEADPERIVQFHWSKRGSWSPDDWCLLLGCFRNGEIIGVQEVSGHDFARLRLVRSGSFLLPHAQGQGFGFEMRRAMLTFAFDGLGALEASSAAHVENRASHAVSMKCGYAAHPPTGALFGDRRGLMLRYHLTSRAWRERPELADGVSVDGLTPVIGRFGAALDGEG